MTLPDISVGSVLPRVKGILAELLSIDPSDIGDDDVVVDNAKEGEDLGLDSLDALKLALALADEYDLYEGVDIDWGRLSTVHDVAAYVCELVSGCADLSPRA